MDNVIEFKQSVEYYLDLSDKSMDEGKPLLALNALRHAMKQVTSMEDLEEILLCRALIYADMGRYENSNSALFELLSKDLALSDCYFSLAQNFYCLDRNDLSTYYFEKIAEIEPDIPTDAISEYLDLSPTVYRDSSYRVVYPTSNDDAVRAKDLMQEERIDEAIEILTEIPKECSNYIDAQNDLAICYLITGEIQKARSVVDETLIVAPNNIVAICNKLIVSKGKMTTNEIMECVLKFEETKDLTTTEKTKIAMTMCDINLHSEAIRYLERTLEDRPYTQLYMILLGIAYFNNMQFDESLDVFDKMLKIDDRDTIAKFYMRYVKKTKEEFLSNNKETLQFEYLPQIPRDEIIRRKSWVVKYFEQSNLTELEDENSIESEKMEWLFNTNQVELELCAVIQIACSNLKRKNEIFENMLLNDNIPKQVKAEICETLICLSAKKLSLTIDGRFFKTKVRRPKEFKQMNKVTRSAFCKAFAVLIFLDETALTKVSDAVKWVESVIVQENLDLRSFEALSGIVLNKIGLTKIYPEDVLCDVLNANLKTYIKYKKQFKME